MSLYIHDNDALPDFPSFICNICFKENTSRTIKSKSKDGASVFGHIIKESKEKELMRNFANILCAYVRISKMDKGHSCMQYNMW